MSEHTLFYDPALEQTPLFKRLPLSEQAINSSSDELYDIIDYQVVVGATFENPEVITEKYAGGVRRYYIGKQLELFAQGFCDIPVVVETEEPTAELSFYILPFDLTQEIVQQIRGGAEPLEFQDFLETLCYGYFDSENIAAADEDEAGIKFWPITPTEIHQFARRQKDYKPEFDGLLEIVTDLGKNPKEASLQPAKAVIYSCSLPGEGGSPRYLVAARIDEAITDYWWRVGVLDSDPRTDQDLARIMNPTNSKIADNSSELLDTLYSVLKQPEAKSLN